MCRHIPYLICVQSKKISSAPPCLVHSTIRSLLRQFCCALALPTYLVFVCSNPTPHCPSTPTAPSSHSSTVHTSPFRLFVTCLAAVSPAFACDISAVPARSLCSPFNLVHLLSTCCPSASRATQIAEHQNGGGDQFVTFEQGPQYNRADRHLP